VALNNTTSSLIQGSVAQSGISQYYTVHVGGICSGSLSNGKFIVQNYSSSYGDHSASKSSYFSQLIFYCYQTGRSQETVILEIANNTPSHIRLFQEAFNFYTSRLHQYVNPHPRRIQRRCSTVEQSVKHARESLSRLPYFGPHWNWSHTDIFTCGYLLPIPEQNDPPQHLLFLPRIHV
jgi:hypothetical protein